jgi:aerobic-type carbon monoxide dehydrogenase small subunit (CoxS/CutS family)
MRFSLNGKIVEAQASPNETLLEFLRNRLRVMSVKKGCDVGECGTCTVLLDGKAVRSCLVLAVQVENREVTTIEGLKKEGKISPIQEAFLEKYGFQCGYCTAGMILATKALLDENPDPSLEDIKEALEGNLCRCTGYEQIIESVLRAAEMMKG